MINQQKQNTNQLFTQTEWFKDKKRPRNDESGEDEELPEGWKSK